jgi:hypothetical protein
MDSVAEAIDHVLREVEAARFDLGMTRFRLEQAEALRRFDRAKVSVADLVQSRTGKKALAAYECIPPARKSDPLRAAGSISGGSRVPAPIA